MNYYLAQVNIAKMLGPIDSPVMQEFVANLDPINALAESSPGFVWRLTTNGTDATSLRVFDDDFIIVNMSVWESREALFQYVYQSNHVEVFKRRKEWFEKMPEMHFALWYVPQGAMPTVAEAMQRLIYLRQNGETPYAFSFKERFTAEEAFLFRHSWPGFGFQNHTISQSGCFFFMLATFPFN